MHLKFVKVKFLPAKLSSDIKDKFCEFQFLLLASKTNLCAFNCLPPLKFIFKSL